MWLLQYISRDTWIDCWNEKLLVKIKSHQFSRKCLRTPIALLTVPLLLCKNNLLYNWWLDSCCHILLVQRKFIKIMAVIFWYLIIWVDELFFFFFFVQNSLKKYSMFHRKKELIRANKTKRMKNWSSEHESFDLCGMLLWHININFSLKIKL